ncbi:unnamed protein product [Owenia fusiformis]|uniref:Uncharacterized protein n=1 Tax=Owenia fusiformis TaxID=6347 RepID=A0A8J1TBR1_OWEFU|nr:unnamed protein product [Owenia fusiformis]
MDEQERKPLLNNRTRTNSEGGQRYDGTGSINYDGSVTNSADFSIPSTLRTRSQSGISINTLPRPPSSSTLSGSIDSQEFYIDPLTLIQACVFVEDAVQYRSIHHKVDQKSLKLYKFYYSRLYQWMLFTVIFLIHILAFFETPSSLKMSSDVRVPGERIKVPCGVTEGVEIVCLLFLTGDLVLKGYCRGKKEIIRSKWLLAYFVILAVSLGDWCVTIGYGCLEVVRFRRMLRPFFLLQNSTLMKKTVNCLRRTLPEVISVLLLLGLHLFFFTLLGMLIFPEEHRTPGKIAPSNMSVIVDQGESKEQHVYFKTLSEATVNLLVLLTTANNPDVMMPAYSENRFYAIYFIVFLVIGLYCFMNMLTAVIYNQFRGYFLNSMQSSLFRRRLAVRATFEVIRRRKITDTQSAHFNVMSEGVPVDVLFPVIKNVKMRPQVQKAILMDLGTRRGILDADQFKEVFDHLENPELQRSNRPEMKWCEQLYLRRLQRMISHKYFNYFGNLVAFANVVVITVEVDIEYKDLLASRETGLSIANLCFVVYYAIEQCFKIWALGWKLYMWKRTNVFDGFITIILVVTQVFFLAFYGIPFRNESGVQFVTSLSLWDAVRLINILIMVRLLRVIPHIKTMSLVASTLGDMVRNMQAFAGIMVVIYYSFAILGLELFQGVIVYSPSVNGTNSTINGTTHFSCGSYQQLEYWANNFDDFAAALVVLWDVMVVNNWMVFLQAFSQVTTPWSQLYFVAWWLIAVVICLNLFTALIIENFIMRWDRNQSTRERSDSAQVATFHPLTVHDMFRDLLKEPTEEELMVELRCHEHLTIR